MRYRSGLLRRGCCATSGWWRRVADECPVSVRTQFFADQHSAALALQVDRELFGARPVAVADLAQVIERRTAAGREGVPGFHRDGVQVVDELHKPNFINWYSQSQANANLSNAKSAR